MADSNVFYDLKTIKFLGRTVQIVLQDENGPCPLLAIANVLLLRNDVRLPTEAHVAKVSQAKLFGVVEHWLLECVDRLKSRAEDPEYMASLEQNLFDAILLLRERKKLCTGVDVNVRFDDIKGFEFTKEVAIFDLLGISLVHGWLVDAKDPLAALLGKKSYNELSTHVAITRAGEENPKRVLLPRNSSSFRSTGSGPTPQDGAVALGSSGSVPMTTAPGDVANARGSLSALLPPDTLTGPPTPVGPVDYEGHLLLEPDERSGERGQAGGKQGLMALDAWDYAEEMDLDDEGYEELQAALLLSASQPDSISAVQTLDSQHPRDTQAEPVTTLEGITSTRSGVPTQIGGGASGDGLDPKLPVHTGAASGEGNGDASTPAFSTSTPPAVPRNAGPGPCDDSTVAAVSTPPRLLEGTCHGPSPDKAGADGNGPGPMELDTVMDFEPHEAVELPVSHPPPLQHVAKGGGAPAAFADEDADLQAALRASMHDATPPPGPKGARSGSPDEDAELEAALRLSLAEATSASPGVRPSKSEEDLQTALRQSMLPQVDVRVPPSPRLPASKPAFPPEGLQPDEDADLQTALKASLWDYLAPSVANGPGASWEESDRGVAGPPSMVDAPKSTIWIYGMEPSPSQKEAAMRAAQHISGPRQGEDDLQRALQLSLLGAVQDRAGGDTTKQSSNIMDMAMQPAELVPLLETPTTTLGVAADDKAGVPLSDSQPAPISGGTNLRSGSADGGRETPMLPIPDLHKVVTPRFTGVPGPDATAAGGSAPPTGASAAEGNVEVLVSPAFRLPPSERAPGAEGDADKSPGTATASTSLGNSPSAAVRASDMHVPPLLHQPVTAPFSDAVPHCPPGEGSMTSVVGGAADEPAHPARANFEMAGLGDDIGAELEQMAASVSAAHVVDVPKQTFEHDTDMSQPSVDVKDVAKKTSEHDTDMPQASTDVSVDTLLKDGFEADSDMPQAPADAVEYGPAGGGGRPIAIVQQNPDEARGEQGAPAPSVGLSDAMDGPQEMEGLQLRGTGDAPMASGDGGGGQPGQGYASGVSPHTEGRANTGDVAADLEGEGLSEDEDDTRRIVKELVRGLIDRAIAGSTDQQLDSAPHASPLDISEEGNAAASSGTEGRTSSERVEQQKRKRDLENAWKVFEFLNSAQLTEVGLRRLQEELQANELAVFFRNNHFNAVFKRDGRLLVLVTDRGYREFEGVVWECLDDVHGNTHFCKDDFTPYREEGSPTASKVPSDANHEALGNGPPAQPTTQSKVAASLLEKAFALHMPRGPVDSDREYALRLQEEYARAQGHIIMDQERPPWADYPGSGPDRNLAYQQAHQGQGPHPTGQHTNGASRPGPSMGPRGGTARGRGQGRHGGRGGQKDGRPECRMM